MLRRQRRSHCRPFLRRVVDDKKITNNCFEPQKRGVDSVRAEKKHHPWGVICAQKWWWWWWWWWWWNKQLSWHCHVLHDRSQVRVCIPKYLQHDCGQNVVYIIRYMETKSRTVVGRHSWNLVQSISCHFIPHQKKEVSLAVPQLTHYKASLFPTVFRSLMLLWFIISVYIHYLPWSLYWYSGTLKNTSKYPILAPTIHPPHMTFLHNNELLRDANKTAESWCLVQRFLAPKKLRENPPV